MIEQTKVIDNAAIYQAVTDYYEGWYTPDEKRMEQCLHTDLAKRAVKLDDMGKEYLRHLTKEVMVDATRDGGGSDAPAEKRNWTITILDSYKEITTVKVTSGEYMEYIHLVKQDGRWLIVNALYTNTRDGS